MPRFQVITVRSLYNGVLIDAEDEEAAMGGRGDIVEESETDTWAERHVSIEKVPGDCQEIELP